MNNVRVGVGVFVVKPDGSFLMGQRRGSHGHETWSVPGGHLEYGESWKETAIREIAEETGLLINPPISLVAVTNDIFPDEKKHYVTLWVKADWSEGEAQILEPDKFVDQDWFTLDNLPEPLFLPWRNLPPLDELKKSLLG